MNEIDESSSHSGCASAHRFDNVLVTCAAANIAFQMLANFNLAGFGVVIAQVDRAHHHAGGAKAALQAVAFFKRRLHRVHGAVFGGQAFNGGDVCTLGLCGQHVA